MTATAALRIGTRGSPLALAQAEETRRRLAEADDGLDPDAIEIVVIKTTGDRVRDRPLAEIGGKGLFTKEIEDALLDGRIDVAVHSMKDMPTVLPPGLAMGAMLPRADPRDALILRSGDGLADLPAGAVVGTTSLRRQALVLHRRPDLKVATLRGNVETRLAKLARGEVDATLLAMAGLQRLGKDHVATCALAPEEMLPAVAQGAIGIEMRADDAATADRLAAIDHAETTTRVAAERAMLAVLDGSCRTPIAGLAELDGNGGLSLRGLVARPDGGEVFEAARGGPAADAAAAAAIGRAVGEELLASAGAMLAALALPEDGAG